MDDLIEKVKNRLRGSLHNSAAVIMNHNPAGENKVLRAINTEVLGVPTLDFDYSKINQLPYNAFYSRIDKSYSFQAFQMISTQEYAHLKNAILLMSYPIKTPLGNKWVSRRSCISKIIDGNPASNAIVNIYSVINDFDGRLSLIRGKFIDPTVEIGNVEHKFHEESTILQERVGSELREDLFSLSAIGMRIWSSKVRNLNNRQIASNINISPHTVKDYVSDVRKVFLDYFGREDIENTKSISKFLSRMKVV